MANKSYRYKKSDSANFGGTSDTYSAGCQTMDQGRFNNFRAALGTQKEFSYVLAAV